MDTQKLTSLLRQCIKKYDMIAPGDHIAVGLSGGKDSYTLLDGLAALRRFYPIPFDLVAIYVDLGVRPFEESQPFVDQMSAFCAGRDVPFRCVRTQIYDIVFSARQEKNPCSLCARLRKGALNEQALALGCNKIAYAHHKDDFIETSLMSLFIEGRYACFPPVTQLDRTRLTVLRPMLYVNEKDVRAYAGKMGFPIMQNPCPADGRTRRQDMKEFIAKSRGDFPALRKNLFCALEKQFDESRMK